MDAWSVASLLTEWRAADRHWETTPQDSPEFRDACIAVLRAWLGYHAAVDAGHPGEFALVTDDERTYVAVSAGVDATLGYAPQAMIGLRIEDFVAPTLLGASGDLWSKFLREGRQDGTIEMVHKNGQVLRMRYQARAHHPIANFHLSRLWPDRDAA